MDLGEPWQICLGGKGALPEFRAKGLGATYRIYVVQVLGNVLKQRDTFVG